MMSMAKVSKYLLLALLFCITWAPLHGCASEAVQASLKIGSNVPDFELKDLNGTVHTLKQYTGNVVVLEMCSIECPWSRGADPHLVELSKKHAADGVVFVGIDSHHSTTVGIKAYAEQAGKSHTIPERCDNKYGCSEPRPPPEVFVVDKAALSITAFDNRQQDTRTKGDKAYVGCHRSGACRKDA